MKQILIIFLFFSSNISFGQTLIEKGNTAYQNEQYEIAIQNYLEAVADDNKSEVLFYNLGNSFFKMNEIGEAIWAYEQAKKINPSNEDIEFNLQFANNLTADKLIIENKGIGSWIIKNGFHFSPNFWFYLSVLFAVLTALALYFFFTPSTSIVNNISLLTTSVFGVLLILSFTFAIMHKKRLTSNTKVVIINPIAKILTTPSKDAKVSFELHEGAQLNLKSIQNNWCEVKFNSTVGWVNKNEVWLF